MSLLEILIINTVLMKILQKEAQQRNTVSSTTYIIIVIH